MRVFLPLRSLPAPASQFQPKDIVDKIKINGVSKGKATLTIDTPVYPNELPKEEKRALGRYTQNIIQEMLDHGKSREAYKLPALFYSYSSQALQIASTTLENSIKWDAFTRTVSPFLR